MNNIFESVVKKLNDYEKRHTPRFHPGGALRFRHWYRLNLFSDGSGFVEDSLEHKVLFRFDDTKELKKELSK